MFKKLTIALALLCAHNAVYSMEELKDCCEVGPDLFALSCFCKEPRTKEDIKRLRIIHSCAQVNAYSFAIKAFRQANTTYDPSQGIPICMPWNAAVICACYSKALDERIKRFAPAIEAMHRD